MGTSSSKMGPRAPQLKKAEEEVVKLMMPVYYMSGPLTDDELALATETWTKIHTNMSDKFIEQSKDPAFPHSSGIVHFYNSFYERLFDVHPSAKALFKNMNSQGRFLVRMISLSLSEKADPIKYEATLIRLAEIHNERGVKAVEYGIVGDVLFWAIRHCIGDGAYTYGVHGAWIKIYSRMLRSMVPVAVAYEMRNGNAQIKRFAGTTSNSSFIGASFLGLGMSSSSLLKSREETVVLPESACLKPEA